MGITSSAPAPPPSTADVLLARLSTALATAGAFAEAHQEQLQHTALYCAFLVWLLLFLSPFRFRHHEGDLYVAVSKVCQTWCFLHIVLFHVLAPYLRRAAPGAGGETETGASLRTALFFPIFAVLTVALLIGHRMKRAAGLRITYAATTAALLLNSALVAVVVTVHCAWCSALFSAETFGDGFHAVMCPYSYATAAQESPRATTGSGGGGGQESTAVMLWLQLTVGSLGLVLLDYGVKLLRNSDPSAGLLWGARVERKTRPPPTHRGAEGRPFAPSAEPFVAVPTVDDDPHSVEAFETTGACGVAKSATAPRGLGMVPWYSLMVFRTALKAFMGFYMTFGQFDSRAVQPHHGPKIFRFTDNARDDGAPTTVPLVPSPGTPRRQDRMDDDSNAAGASSASEQASGSASSLPPPAKPAVEPVSVPEFTAEDGAEDFWFDWAADVGDGFDSTYAIARQLAQPALSVEVPLESRPGRLGQLRGQIGRVRASVKNRMDAAARRGSEVRHRMAQRVLRRRATSEPPRPTPHHTPRPQGATTSSADAAARLPPLHLSLSSSDFFPDGCLSDADTPIVDGRRTDLPRGRLLLLGGDLAYPMATLPDYRDRFFAVYAAALPFRGPARLPAKAPAASSREAVMLLPRRNTTSSEPPHHQVLSKKEEKGMAKEKGVEHHHAPCLFAIPGNHDWLDGLETYRGTVLTFDHLGGWSMPQTTSYFALHLPHNWWLFCLDSGVAADIDQPQMQYFIRLAHTIGPAASVVVTVHEPMWISDAYERPKGPHSMPRVTTVVRALGRRCRMRLAGDIHNYSRYVPEPTPTTAKPSTSSSAHQSAASSGDGVDTKPEEHTPVLVVSGGGGAFLHGTSVPGRDISVYGKRYRRAATYPQPSRRFSVAWVLRFRLVNWKFDLLGALLYFAIVASLLPVDVDRALADSLRLLAAAHPTDGVDPSIDATWELLVRWAGPVVPYVPAVLLRDIGLTTLWCLRRLVMDAVASLVVAAVVVVACLSVAGSARTPVARIALGVGHAAAHIIAAVLLLAALSVVFHRALALGLVASTAEVWSSGLAATATDAAAAAVAICGPPCAMVSSIADPADGLLPGRIGAVLHLGGRWAWWVLMQCLSTLDLAEGAVHLHGALIAASRVPQGCPATALMNSTGAFSNSVAAGGDPSTRLQWGLYYLHVFLLYWALAAPVASLILGGYLCACSSFWQCAWHEAFSAFQIERTKHFLRCKIRAADGALEVHAVGTDDIPEAWARDASHDAEEIARPPCSGATAAASDTAHHRPVGADEGSHTMARPSVWAPAGKRARGRGAQPRLVDAFVVTRTPAPEGQ